MNGIEENIITASKKSRFFALPKIVLSLRTKTKLRKNLSNLFSVVVNKRLQIIRFIVDSSLNLIMTECVKHPIKSSFIAVSDYLLFCSHSSIFESFNILKTKILKTKMFY